LSQNEGLKWPQFLWVLKSHQFYDLFLSNFCKILWTSQKVLKFLTKVFKKSLFLVPRLDPKNRLFWTCLIFDPFLVLMLIVKATKNFKKSLQKNTTFCKFFQNFPFLALFWGPEGYPLKVDKNGKNDGRQQ
jgi:hypothetical protein